MSSSPALNALFEIVPHHRHEWLNQWIEEWTGRAYATNEILVDPRQTGSSKMIEGIRRKLTSVLANEATDKAVMFVEEFYTKGRDELIFSASAFYLLPRKAEKKGPTT